MCAVHQQSTFLPRAEKSQYLNSILKQPSGLSLVLLQMVAISFLKHFSINFHNSRLRIPQKRNPFYLQTIILAVKRLPQKYAYDKLAVERYTDTRSKVLVFCCLFFFLIKRSYLKFSATITIIVFALTILLMAPPINFPNKPIQVEAICTSNLNPSRSKPVFPLYI